MPKLGRDPHPRPAAAPRLRRRRAPDLAAESSRPAIVGSPFPPLGRMSKAWQRWGNSRFWLTEAQVERLRPLFPKARGRARMDDRQVLSGIIHVQRNGLTWKDAPAVHGRPKTPCNRWTRWSRMGVFARILLGLAAEGQDTETVTIDATRLKAHRTASSLPGQKGASERGEGA